MDRRAWRVTGLQLAIVGLEAVWVALMALVLSPGRAVGGAVLLGTGIVTLLWNRWLLRRSWWERGWGRAAGLLGMLLLLVAAGWAAEPALMARAAAEPEYRLRVAILLGSKSLLVAWLAAVTVMARIVLLL